MVVLEKEEGTTIDNNRASVNTRQWDDKASIMPLVDDVNGAMDAVVMLNTQEVEEEMDNSNT